MINQSNPEELSPLERAVIDLLLDGADSVKATLREQIRRSRVKSREFTGVGFFCDIEVDPLAPKLSGNFELGDVVADIPPLKHGAGFVLFVRNGQVSDLEGYTYDETWPIETKDFTLKKVDVFKNTI